MDHPHEQQPTEHGSETRAAYSPPAVVSLGRFADLTRSGSGSVSDDFGGFQGDSGTLPD
jgi:hypothetical protein